MYKLINKLTIFLSISFLLHTLSPLQADDPVASSPLTEARSTFSDYYKKFKYEASLAYTKRSQGDWWTKIEPFNLYLGAIPLDNHGHLQSIIDLGVTHVLSMVEDFEMQEGWLNTPVTQEAWKAHGIEVKQIQAEDFNPLTPAELEEGIEYLARALEQKGNIVYVHCKAGRGRSASVVIGYLMKYQHFSFADAVFLVKQQRPQINLNKYQREAILNYFAQEIATDDPAVSQKLFSLDIYNLFHNVNDLSEEGLSRFLDGLLYYVIEGVDSADLAPAFASYMPNIQSTHARAKRYLREFNGDQEAATKAAIERNHGLVRRLKVWATRAVPFVGAPSAHSLSLWYQLREISLIAAIHGHDIYDKEVRMKILSCLVGGDMLKLPALSVKQVAKAIAKRILPDLAPSAIVAIPARMIFDYFTDNAARVATHANAMFAGENSIAIEKELYTN